MTGATISHRSHVVSKKERKKEKKAFVEFLDSKKAFDTVWHHGFLFKYFFCTEELYSCGLLMWEWPSRGFMDVINL